MADISPDAPSSSGSQNSDERYDWRYLKRGAVNLFSLPALVLMSAFVGYGGIAREAGLTLGETAFSVPTIWALPSHLILVAGIAAGASMLTIAIAVALASVRMLPMTMALVPEIRARHSTTWHLLLACTLVALTAWVHTLQEARNLPRNARLPYYVGFVSILAVCATATASITYVVAGTIPIMLMAGLYFLAPLYFGASIWRTSEGPSEHLAVFLGLFLAPVLAIWWPQYTILIAGLVGGLLAYGHHRWRKRKSASGS